MECFDAMSHTVVGGNTVKNSVKNTVKNTVRNDLMHCQCLAGGTKGQKYDQEYREYKSTAEIGKPGILKNERKKDITLILLVVQEGPLGQGQSGSISVKCQYLCN